MRIYLDDNILHPRLVALLRRVGHTVVLPTDVGTAGVSDPNHLRYALEHDWTVLTANYRDFEDLHKLVIASGGRHSGVLLVRFDNNAKTDMKNPAIVRAVGKLAASGLPVKDELHILNHWQ